jgi:hypothetical protein
MRVGLPTSNSQTCIDEQDATLGPRDQQSSFVGWCLEIGVVFLERNVYVLERWGSRGGCLDREAEAMGLIGAVVGVLSCNYGFHGVKGCVSRPIGCH